ncbi:phosphoglycerate mutase family protein [Candidatus Nomurabacteria bacterium]|nr:phosphoglycerate mutase family protein [Candidatus Nomurabacteria bacterium]
MLYFIRHGESKANLDEVFAGAQVDSPLTELGKLQALNSAKELKELGVVFDRIISSPLIRAVDTAKIIQEEIGFEGNIEIDHRITEYDFGSLTNKKKDKMKLKNGEIFFALKAESITSLELRVHSFLDEFRDTSDNILVSAHGIVIMMARAITEGYDISNFYTITPQKNGEIWITD